MSKMSKVYVYRSDYGIDVAEVERVLSRLAETTDSCDVAWTRTGVGVDLKMKRLPELPSSGLVVRKMSVFCNLAPSEGRARDLLGMIDRVALRGIGVGFDWRFRDSDCGIRRYRVSFAKEEAFDKISLWLERSPQCDPEIMVTQFRRFGELAGIPLAARVEGGKWYVERSDGGRIVYLSSGMDHAKPDAISLRLDPGGVMSWTDVGSRFLGEFSKEKIAGLSCFYSAESVGVEEGWRLMRSLEGAKSYEGAITLYLQSPSGINMVPALIGPRSQADFHIANCHIGGLRVEVYLVLGKQGMAIQVQTRDESDPDVLSKALGLKVSLRSLPHT
jgi:hypothetical protein